MAFNGYYHEDEYPYYEDTHSANDYSTKLQNYQRDSLFASHGNTMQSAPAPKGKDTRNFKNLMMYEPKSEIDSKTIIDFIKQKEPAIINLEGANPAVSQRILDFVSGAVYALSGSVHRVSGNIFLISPSGVEVTVPGDSENE